MLKHARILYGYQHIIDCMICDVSSEGASLAVLEAKYLPEKFDLITDSGDCFACLVVNKSDVRINVLFTETSEPEDKHERKALVGC